MPLIGADKIDVVDASGTHRTVADQDLALNAGVGGATGAGITAPTADTITAHAAGGQTSATQLSALFNRVTTVATAADSVKLPQALAGMRCKVRNDDAAKACAVFPYTGDAINALSANASISLSAGAEAEFFCATTGTWRCLIGVGPANGLAFSPRNIATGNAPATTTTQGTDTATNATTEVYLAEITVPGNVSTTGGSVLNGSAVAGNVTYYLYDSNGAFVAKTASTAQSGTAAYQQIAWTGGPIALKGPGTYYIGWSGDTTGGTQKYRSHILGNFGAGKVTGQVYGTQPATAAGNAPTTFTTNLGPIASLY